MIVTTLLAALLGCVKSEHGGTVVGNPGESSPKLAPATGMETSQARMAVSGVERTDCTGEVADNGQEAVTEHDLVAGSPAIVLPGGEACALTITLDGPLSVTFDTAEGAVEVEVPLGALELVTDTAITINGGEYVLEIGYPGWLSDVELLEAGDDLGEQLADRLRESAALFLDVDADGAVSADERNGGLRLTGSARPDEESFFWDTGFFGDSGFMWDTGLLYWETGLWGDTGEGVPADGCGSGSAGAWIWLLLLPLGWRTRDWGR